MGFRPRDCLTHYHLIALAGLVAIALILVLVGGLLPAWCIRYEDTFECHSLLHSERGFSCLFKLIPVGIIICLILSLFMFIILIIGQVHREYSGLAKKEYQLVARFVNILLLSIAIILIMVVLLQWFHPPANASKSLSIVMVPVHDRTDKAIKQEQMVLANVSPNNPEYLKAIGAHRQSILKYHQIIHHGPNLFFAAFVIVFIALLAFVIAHRMSN